VRRARRMPVAARTARELIAIAAVLLFAGPLALAQTLEVTPASGVAFPNRTLVLSVPRTASVTSAHVHVTENGRQVSGLTTTSLHQANLGDLGVVLVIDSDPTMAGAPLTQAMVAARSLAAQRTGNQELGAVFGDGSTLPLTADPQAIRAFLAHPPHIVHQTHLLGATQQAIDELRAANVVAGAVIYVSDDMDRAPGLSPQSLARLATSAHIRIFTVAVSDPATARPGPNDLPPNSMAILAQEAGGSFSQAVPAQLRRAFTQIEAGLTSQYIVHYRSSQQSGQRIRVTMHVDGVPGTYRTTYRSPSLPVLPPGTRPAPRGSFWASSVAVVVVAIVCGLLVGVAVAVLVAKFSRSGQLRARVQAFAAPSAELVVDRPVTESKRRLGVWERLLERRRWWPAFIEQVSISSITRSPQELVRFAVAGSLLAAVALELMTGSILLALAGLFVGPLVVRAVVTRNVRQTRMHFAEQLSGQLHEIASALRVGRSIVEAFEIVEESADEPMRRELRRALADERAGLHLDQVLPPIATRMDSPEVEQVAVIAALHRRTGANITEVLDRIADTARQRVEIRRELNTMTAQARMSRAILTALPVFVVVAIDIISHRYERPLFHTTAGILVLVAAGLMVTLGARIMKSMTHIED
jgi:tight adherence protein B